MDVTVSAPAPEIDDSPEEQKVISARLKRLKIIVWRDFYKYPCLRAKTQHTQVDSDAIFNGHTGERLGCAEHRA